MMTTDDMSDNMYTLIRSLPKDAIISLMFEALDRMQGYNGRSVKSCILDTMGAEEIEDGKYKLPSKYKLRKDWA